MHPSVVYPFEARIAKRTERQANGCLVWTGSKVGDTGYGKMTIDKRDHRVHRAMWEHHNGPIPPGINVLHKCDNPPCCEVAHLFLGTCQDNSDDQYAKGRRVVGAHVGTSKLCAAEVQVARSLLPVCSQAEVARLLDISTSQMHRIAHGLSWRGV